jgi:hypothetical protein
MNRDLVVQVADCAGIYSETSCTDWKHALSVAALMKRTYSDKYVDVVDRSRVDLGCGDGLTEEERDEAYEAMYPVPEGFRVACRQALAGGGK